MNQPMWQIRSAADIGDEGVLGGWASIAVGEDRLVELLGGRGGEDAMREALAAVYESSDGLNVFRRRVTVTAYMKSERRTDGPDEVLYDIQYDDAGPMRR